MKQLAAEGRTVFVSSHLMSEISVTPDHLIVLGKGKLPADRSTQKFIERSSHWPVLVRSPDAARLASLITGASGTVRPDAVDGDPAGPLSVIGLDASRIGDLAARAGLVLHELAPRFAWLEAFPESTAGSAEYRAAGRGAPARPRAPSHSSGRLACCSRSPRGGSADCGRGDPVR